MPHAVARAPARRGHAAARAGQREALDAFLRGVERRALRIAEISCATREEALDRVRAAMLAFAREAGGKPASAWPLHFWRALDRALAAPGGNRPAPAVARGAGEPAPRAGDALHALERALRALPRLERHAFLLRVWQGLDLAQVAHVLDLPADRVRLHLFQALQELGTRIGARHG